MKFKLFLVALCFTVTFTNTAIGQAEECSQVKPCQCLPARLNLLLPTKTAELYKKR